MNRYLQYLIIAMALSAIWEQMRRTKATDPQTVNDDYAGVAAEMLSRPKVQRTLEAMSPEEAQKTVDGLPGSLRLLDALTE
jgi:hypothetical protein